jgi:hypothetical protein
VPYIIVSPWTVGGLVCHDPQEADGYEPTGIVVVEASTKT